MFDLGTIGAGLNIVSGLMGSRSAKKAAEAQRRALAQAMQMRQGVYQQSRGDNQPYQQLGSEGVNQLTAGLRDGSLTRQFTNADFQADPGYEFRMNEGQRGVQSSAAARGGALSGAAMKALERYRQGFASNEFDKAYQRFTGNQTQRYNMLRGATGVGEGAVGRLNNIDADYADDMTGMITGQGNAQAAGQIGSSNALTQGLVGGFNAWQRNRAINALNQGPYAGGNIGSNPGYNWGDY